MEWSHFASGGCAMTVIFTHRGAREGTREPDPAEHVRPTPDEWTGFAEHFKLSPRQLEVAKLLYGDEPIKTLARYLGCAPGTVEVHRMKLYRKTRAHDRTGLVRAILEFCVARRSGGRLPLPM